MIYSKREIVLLIKKSADVEHKTSFNEEWQYMSYDYILILRVTHSKRKSRVYLFA
jgi:hypothetical protein